MEHHYDQSLAELAECSVGRLLMAEVFDEKAFVDLEKYLWKKAEGMKDEHVISKQVLKLLLSASSAVRSRAEYIPEVAAHLQWADRFEMMLHQFVDGETVQHRRPGVPRVL